MPSVSCNLNSKDNTCFEDKDGVTEVQMIYFLCNNLTILETIIYISIVSFNPALINILLNYQLIIYKMWTFRQVTISLYCRKNRI